MAERTVYDVTPRGELWAVKRRGAERASDLFEKKDDAIERARELALAIGHSQVVIHGRDGKIQTEYDDHRLALVVPPLPRAAPAPLRAAPREHSCRHGDDPYPPKG